MTSRSVMITLTESSPSRRIAGAKNPLTERDVRRGGAIHEQGRLLHLGKQLVDTPPHQLSLRAAEQHARLGVHERDPEIGAQRDDGVRRLFEQDSSPASARSARTRSLCSRIRAATRACSSSGE